ncbi:MAG: TIGR01620 family protein [Pseudomonadota bacterium]
MSDAPNKGRAPRSFAVGAPIPAPSETKAAKAEPAKAARKSKPRAKAKPSSGPRSFELSSAFKTTDDSAAQRLTQDEQDAFEALTPPPISQRKRGLRWGRVFLGALGALLSLAFGLWVDGLVRALFARGDWLGWLALAVTGLVALSAIIIIARELLALRRLTRIDALRQEAMECYNSNDVAKARTLIKSLTALSGPKGQAAVQELDGEVIDGRDLIVLTERALYAPLDQEARALVLGAAKRVSIVTAVSPRAIVDIGYVLVENARLIRALSELYGGRPGTLGFVRLARTVITHLAVTGSIAVGDGLLQQVVGSGLAARLSTRLGEGVINGLLTARIGISAMDVCRPMPYLEVKRPSAGDFLSDLTRLSGSGDENRK